MALIEDELDKDLQHLDKLKEDDSYLKKTLSFLKGAANLAPPILIPSLAGKLNQSIYKAATGKDIDLPESNIGIGIPLLKLEEPATKALDYLGIENKPVRGLTRAVASVGESLTTPENIAALPLIAEVKAGSLLAKGLGLGFGGLMGKSAIEQGLAAKEQASAGNTEEAYKHGGESVASALMSGLGLFGGLRKPKLKPNEPLTTDLKLPDVPSGPAGPSSPPIENVPRETLKNFEPSKPVKIEEQNLSQDKNLIASTGLTTGRSVNPEKFTGIRMDKIKGPDDLIKFVESAKKENKEFSEQRISKSNEEVDRLADTVGLSSEELLKTLPGSIVNSESLRATQKLIEDAGKDYHSYLNTFDTTTATPEQKAIAAQKYLNLTGLLKTFSGFRTEASHIFRTLGRGIDFESAARKGVFDDLLIKSKQLGMDTSDLPSLIRKTKELQDPTLGDKLWHLWYASILSGPTTHFKNIIGNAGELVSETALQALIDPLGLPSYLKGASQGLKAGTKEGFRILKEGSPSKYEGSKKPIRFKGAASILNVADYISRALSSVDAFFRGGFEGAEKRTLANKQASKEGLKLLSKEKQNRINELVANPPKNIKLESEALGDRGTYTQDPEGVLGSLSQGLALAGKRSNIVKSIVPFTRVVANVLNNSLDWTPVGFGRASGKFKNRLKPGEDYTEGKFTNRQVNKELGRAVVGTSLMAAILKGFLDGHLTGRGPSDPDKRAQILGSGARFNSIVVGEGKNKTYIPYTYLAGPLGMALAIASNYNDAVKYGDLPEDEILKRTSVALLGTGDYILDKSFLTGASELLSNIKNYDRGGDKFLARFIASNAGVLIPNFVKQIARYYDPTIYDTQTINEMLLSSVRATSSLKPKIDAFGDVVIGDRMPSLSPSKLKENSIKTWLSERNLWVGAPAKSSKLQDQNTGEKRKMTRDEYYNYVKYSGKLLKRDIIENLPSIEETLKLEGAEAAQDIIDDYVKMAREKTKQYLSDGLGPKQIENFESLKGDKK